jgi:hypothetical protein
MMGKCHGFVFFQTFKQFKGRHASHIAGPENVSLVPPIIDIFVPVIVPILIWGPLL